MNAEFIKFIYYDVQCSMVFDTTAVAHRKIMLVGSSRFRRNAISVVVVVAAVSCDILNFHVAKNILKMKNRHNFPNSKEC